jgi:hypothetical protein
MEEGCCRFNPDSAVRLSDGESGVAKTLEFHFEVFLALVSPPPIV